MTKGCWIARVDISDMERYKSCIAANADPLHRGSRHHRRLRRAAVTRAILQCVVAAAWCLCSWNVMAQSPYAGQEGRDVKALSVDDVGGYLAGKGMGLAKVAELNGYPGSLHVLELASELSLSRKQRAATEALFASMQIKASELGHALIAEERTLDRMFGDKTITTERLTAALSEISKVQARIRGAHLEAHLIQTEILTRAQTARYAQLRGYGGGHDPKRAHDGLHKH